MDPQHNPPVNSESSAASPEPVDDAQLTLGAWLARNGPTLLLLVGAVAAALHFKGVDFLVGILMVAAGLGVVIFIHELGHFLVAKWCDVHVQTFSIGFGPALPGCSFTRGETTYKIALFPLGGYVKMVGEGDDNNDEDSDPRSFKNKTVGQRMAIISAGVVMNVILGLIAFVIAFQVGVHQQAPVISILEPAGPAWTAGVRTGTVVDKVGSIENPYFNDIRMQVMLSDHGEEVPFVMHTLGGEPYSLGLVPRKDKSDPNPVIGVRWPDRLAMPAQRYFKEYTVPVQPGSAAAAARVLDVGPGDVVLAATDAKGDLTPLAKPGDVVELAHRVLDRAGKPLELRVRRASGAEETVTSAADGFHFDDEVIGVTEDAAKPFDVTELPLDPRDPQGRNRDLFEFLRRLNRMADRPVVIRVERKSKSAAPERVDLFVPPEYAKVVSGLRMERGEVRGLRDHSSAAVKGMKIGDLIEAIALKDGKGEQVAFARQPTKGERRLDPLRLRDELRAWADGRKDVVADVTVKRKQGNKDAEPTALVGLAWDASWRFNEEFPIGRGEACFSLPELGIAYQVRAAVEDVAADSPAAASLQAGDVILRIWLPDTSGKAPYLDKPIDLTNKEDPRADPAARWAWVFFDKFQSLPAPRVQLEVRRGGETLPPFEVAVSEDRSWALHSGIGPRGLILIPDQDRIARADSLAAAASMGMRHTTRTILTIYQSLKSMATRRVAFEDSVSGPIGIAMLSYETANRSWADLVLVVGIISINLAVVNFLPIPVLDGGHMVFLLYEKLRGRPAPETVRAAATWCGVLLLLSLMAFVIYLDFRRFIL